MEILWSYNKKKGLTIHAIFHSDFHDDMSPTPAFYTHIKTPCTVERNFRIVNTRIKQFMKTVHQSAYRLKCKDTDSFWI